MIRQPPRATRTYTLFPYTTLCRSILKAANALIANNQGRLGKELWTSGCEGEPISLYAAFNEHDEARYVVESIEKAIRDGMSRSEEHTSELQSLMRISYAVFCLKKKTKQKTTQQKSAIDTTEY